MTYSLDDLTALLKDWGQPAFRGKQIYEWIHKHHASSYDDMTNLPQTLRKRLEEQFPLNAISIVDRQQSRDGSRKYLLQLGDGHLVETVGLPSFDQDGLITRLSVCVSSQVGCAMACTFCATGKEGFSRNLTAAEIIEQVTTVQKDFNHRVSNVVVMGQGEPFLNYDEVLTALKILNDSSDLNIGARHITLSTCGLLEGIEKLSLEKEQFTLAISLHSALQSSRNKLMPRVKNQPLSNLKDSLALYHERTGRRVSLEYLMLKGINDDEAHLQALLSFCEGLCVHVNLLPMNSVPGSPLQPSDRARTMHWHRVLNEMGIETTLRVSRGADIAGACGQLKNSLALN